ncbi:hypothetical protein [Litorimonas sp. WD9-15]|uniref:hypothetical protein n=1 Tax=Litorimonas sp. WD9-15 TaxID=3418716 RepID=UPI003D03B2B3
MWSKFKERSNEVDEEVDLIVEKAISALLEKNGYVSLGYDSEFLPEGISLKIKRSGKGYVMDGDIDGDTFLIYSFSDHENPNFEVFVKTSDFIDPMKGSLGFTPVFSSDWLDKIPSSKKRLFLQKIAMTLYVFGYRKIFSTKHPSSIKYAKKIKILGAKDFNIDVNALKNWMLAISNFRSQPFETEAT